jgi:hypothetical protein
LVTALKFSYQDTASDDPYDFESTAALPSPRFHSVKIAEKRAAPAPGKAKPFKGFRVPGKAKAFISQSGQEDKENQE